jgi:hypothetical protein
MPDVEVPMAIVAILGFFLIMVSALFVAGGFASSALGFIALAVTLTIALIALVGLFTFIRHDELPRTFNPREHHP